MIETKRCNACRADKVLGDFTNSVSSKDGKCHYCKSCASIRKAAWRKTSNAKNWNRHPGGKDNPKNRKEYNLRYSYNLSPERFEAMLDAQSNKCAGCRMEFEGSVKASKPHVDHDHSCCPGTRSCGYCVRWLLCSKCNHVLGLLKDSVVILRRLANGLEDYTNAKKAASEAAIEPLRHYPSRNVKRRQHKGANGSN